MKRRILAALFSYQLVQAAFAAAPPSCPPAAPTNDVNFCTSFRTVAPCYCIASGAPAGMCQDMNTLYSRMIWVWGTLENACNHQPFTTPQDCIDNWNCFLVGGVDSRGRICSSTYKAC